MEFIKTIIDKLRLKELFAIIFISALFITFIPSDLANTLQISDFRNTYQSYISIGIIVPGAYYIFTVFNWAVGYIYHKIHNTKRIAIKYMKEYISPDEMSLLIEKFYDERNNRFKSNAAIELQDGRQTALEQKFILYMSSNVGNWSGFAYNLQPYALDFLNRNLKEGNIKIYPDKYQWNLK